MTHLTEIDLDRLGKKAQKLDDTGLVRQSYSLKNRHRNGTCKDQDTALRSVDLRCVEDRRIERREC